MRKEIRSVEGKVDGKVYCWTVVEHDGKIVQESCYYEGARQAAKSKVFGKK